MLKEDKENFEERMKKVLDEQNEAKIQVSSQRGENETLKDELF